MPDLSDGHPLVLFDGECGFCDKNVQFALKHDPSGTLRFATLQGNVGQQSLRALGLPADFRDTVILIDEAGVHLRSTAAWRIALNFSGPARLLSWLRLIPRPLRDVGYRIVSRYRYKLFGQANACRVPKPGERERFLD